MLVPQSTLSQKISNNSLPISFTAVQLLTRKQELPLSLNAQYVCVFVDFRPKSASEPAGLKINVSRNPFPP